MGGDSFIRASYGRALGDGSSAGRVRDGSQALHSSSVSHTLGLALALKLSKTPSCGELEGLGVGHKGGEGSSSQPACLHVDDGFQLNYWDGIFFF